MSKGRGNGNSLTIKETVRINIDALKKSKCLNKGAVTSFKSEWSGGASLMGIITYTDKEKTLTLKYLYGKKPIEYKVQIAEVNSNLGKGVNLYFICPATGIKCKTIFCCYGSEIFKSREAYNNRIYYLTQISSKPLRPATRYNVTETKVNELYKLRTAKNYKGKETKRHKRLIKLIDKKHQLDMLKDEEIEKWLYKYLGLAKYQNIHKA
jgi:hypothetical protein